MKKLYALFMKNIFYDLGYFNMSINEIVKGFSQILRNHGLLKSFLHMFDSRFNELISNV